MAKKKAAKSPKRENTICFARRDNATDRLSAPHLVYEAWRV